MGLKIGNKPQEEPGVVLPRRGTFLANWGGLVLAYGKNPVAFILGVGYSTFWCPCFTPGFNRGFPKGLEKGWVFFLPRTRDVKG